MVAIRKNLSAADVLVRQTRNGGSTERTPRAAAGAQRVRVIDPAAAPARAAGVTAPVAPTAPTAAAAPVVAPAAVANATASAPVAGLDMEVTIARIVAATVLAMRAEAPVVEAPAVHTTPGDRRTIRDLELMSLDAGMTQEQVDQWRSARMGELPAIPTNHRFRSTHGRKQFRQMRGGRNFGSRFAMRMRPTSFTSSSASKARRMNL